MRAGLGCLMNLIEMNLEGFLGLGLILGVGKSLQRRLSVRAAPAPAGQCPLPAPSATCCDSELEAPTSAFHPSGPWLPAVANLWVAVWFRLVFQQFQQSSGLPSSFLGHVECVGSVFLIGRWYLVLAAPGGPSEGHPPVADNMRSAWPVLCAHTFLMSAAGV